MANWTARHWDGWIPRRWADETMVGQKRKAAWWRPSVRFGSGKRRQRIKKDASIIRSRLNGFLTNLSISLDMDHLLSVVCPTPEYVLAAAKCKEFLPDL